MEQSQIKKQAKLLTEQAKKYGYEIKHTHALELVSQLLTNTNRHAALKNEAEYVPLIVAEPHLFKLGNFPHTIDIPFFQAYVLEFNCGDENVDFVVTDSLRTAFELMGESCLQLDHLRIMKPEELDLKLSSLDEDTGERGEEKTLMEWIMAKHKACKSQHFTVFNDYDF